MLQDSDVIVAVADDLLGVLAQSWDVYDRQCMVVPNWVPLDRVVPKNKANAWSSAMGMAGKRLAVYTGVLSSPESPATLLDLAWRLRNVSDFQLVVVSEGPGANALGEAAVSKGLSNIRVIPFQPYELYSDVLASADVLIAALNEDAGILFVPTNVYSYLCAERPIVLAAPWNNVAAQAVRASKGGQVVPPGDWGAMAQAILTFLNDDALRQKTGKAARLYAETKFDISNITDRFERSNAFIRARRVAYVLAADRR